MSLGEIWLAPLDGEPAVGKDWYASDRLIAVLQGPSIVIRSRIVEGRSWITIHTLEAEPGPLEKHLRQGNWEVAEEEDININAPVHLGSPTGNEWTSDVVVPELPGLHRVRVLAKGHVLNDPFENVDFEEEFEVFVWPAERSSTRQRVMDKATPWRRRSPHP